MGRSLKKLLVLTLIVTLFITVLTGCGSPDIPSAESDISGDETSGNSTPAEIVEISVMLFDRGNIPDGEGTADDNRWTRWINEQMAPKGVQVKFILVPRSEEGAKIPVMMASGTAADIMMSYDYTLVKKYYQDGGTYELSQYINDYGSTLVEYIGEECLAGGRLEDGSQYAIPARRSTTALLNSFIRKDWLDKLNLSIPKTVDELYNALKAFKEQDPGNIGSDKIIPFNGGGGNLRFAFLKELDYKQYLINSVHFAYTDEGEKEYYRYRNKLYNEGLMDPEYFTANDGGQKAKENIVAGIAGYYEDCVNFNVDNLRGGLLQNLKKNIPDAEFISIPPIANMHDGNVYNPAYSPMGAFNFIPMTAESPEACIKYLDFLAGEGGFAIYHGFEGEHFDFSDGVPVVKDPDYNAKTKDWIRHDLFLVGNQGYFETEEEFAFTTSKELPGWEQYVIDNYRNAAEGICLAEHPYSSPTQIEQSGNIGKVNENYNTKLTTCRPDEFDAIFDEYIAELKKYDMDKIIAERTEYFNKVIE